MNDNSKTPEPTPKSPVTEEDYNVWVMIDRGKPDACVGYVDDVEHEAGFAELNEGDAAIWDAWDTWENGDGPKPEIEADALPKVRASAIVFLADGDQDVVFYDRLTYATKAEELIWWKQA